MEGTGTLPWSWRLSGMGRWALKGPFWGKKMLPKVSVSLSPTCSYVKKPRSFRQHRQRGALPLFLKSVGRMALYSLFGDF